MVNGKSMSNLILLNIKSSFLVLIKCSSVLLFLLFCTPLFAQTDDVEISGKVTDGQNNSLSNVAIYIQEKKQAVFTLTDGTFKLSCSNNDRLVFKKEGYNDVVIAGSEVEGKTIVLIKSLIDAGNNDDVYIPFATIKKREASATINLVKGENLAQIPLSTLNNTLTGRLPGLYISQTGNRPGTDDANFLIRGRSSYNAGQSPLVLVDGVARDFVDMDANEIESISVLKDAGTLSWYGMNGANGVIYVTTKRGSATNTKVTFDSQGGVQLPVNLANPLNSYAYAFLYNEARQNDGQIPQYSQADLIGYFNNTDNFKYPNNDLPSLFLKKASPVQRYVTTISGGNAFARYFTMVSLYDQDGLYKFSDNANYNSNTNFRRYNFRTNLDLHINKSLDVSLDVGGRVANLNYPRDGNTSLLNTILSTPSNAFAITNVNGTYGGSPLFRNNPLAMLQARGNVTDLYRTLLATVNVTQKLDKIAKGLSLNVLYTYDMTGLYTYGFTQNYEVYELSNVGTYNRFGNQTPLDYASSAFSGNLRNNELWAGLDYNYTQNKHSLKFSSRFQRAVSSSSGRLDDKREGLSNRLSYNYNQKYFTDVIATYSGSQTFIKGNRYGFFPAISSGWIVSEESFLKNNKFLNYLKFRGSIGLVGNDGVGASRRFAFNDYFTRGGSQYFFGTGFSTVPNTAQLDLANPNLTWEKAQKMSLGFDSKFLNQALSLSADFFQEIRTDLLTADLLPSIIGKPLVQINAGKAQYKGVEGELNYNKTIGKINLNLFTNYTYVKSEVLAINEEAGIPSYQTQVGFPIGGVVYGTGNVRRFLVSDGIFQSDADINSSAKQKFAGNVKPGDIKYKDINNDGFIDNLDFVSTNFSDIPTSYFGFGTSLKYKNIDFSVLFQGVAGRTIQVSTLVNAGTANTGYINQFSVNRWTPATSETALYPRLTINDRANNNQNSDYWLRSGDFIRLKNIELGYSLSSKTLQKLKISNCRFYLTGFNVLTFDKMDNSLPIDPEIPEAGFNSSYPYLATYALGLNIKF
jgi:TonB-linked SusC/RagA family outer membrane protein